jgi:thiol-disulfide isomerase/thioredoxin
MRHLVLLAGMLLAGSAQYAPAQSSSATGPADPKSAKVYGNAIRELNAHKFPLALADFRKADQMDGGHCVACETQAYEAARRLGDFDTAREEAGLLVAHATTDQGRAAAHALAGDICLAQGGYRIFQEPFQAADSEYQAALQLSPGKLDCIYHDAVALAHLGQYQKARERFQEFAKLAPPTDFELTHAKLFAGRPDLARKRVVPDFRFKTLDGKSISMQELSGKVVLIDFWATWCGPCKNALPHLREIAQKFQGQPLVVLSISLDEDETTWKSFVAGNAMTWAQYRDGGFDGPIATQFGVKAIPTTFTVDKDGFVQDRRVGDGNIETTIKELIAQAQNGAGKAEEAKAQAQ